MSVESFSAWFFEQPELIQNLVLYGPPVLVSAGITLALGGRIRMVWLSWLSNPALAASIEAERQAVEDEAAAEWTHAAKDSVDELIARRRRGIH